MVTMSLDPPTRAARSHRADVEVDHYESLVMAACEVLDEAGCRFHMGGFGRGDWGVDVSYDLSVVVEQLPDLLGALHSGAEAELDMYSQGIERRLLFRPHGDTVTIRCVPYDHGVHPGTPVPDVEQLPLNVVLSMLEDLAVGFGRAITAVDPELGRHGPFERWSRGIVH